LETRLGRGWRPRSAVPRLRARRWAIQKFGVPGVDLFWTFRVPAMYPGLPFRRSWPPQSANRFAFTRGTGPGPGTFAPCARWRLRPSPGAPRWRPWSAEGQAGYRRSVPARERCPAGAPWRGRRLDRHREGVATYGLAGYGPAGSRPAPARPVRGGTARCRRRGPPAWFPSRGPGTVSGTGSVGIRSTGPLCGYLATVVPGSVGGRSADGPAGGRAPPRPVGTAEVRYRPRSRRSCTCWPPPSGRAGPVLDQRCSGGHRLPSAGGLLAGPSGG
jgi:hypothetical protein